MRIIIVGMGQAGSLFAKQISKGSHDVIIVDENKSIVEYMTDNYSVSGVCGNGAAKQVLVAAGAETADVVVALTKSDEVNLLVCQVAKKCGTKYSVARVNHPDYQNDRDYLIQEFQLDYVINSKRDTADVIEKHIGLPGSLKAEGFFGDVATMIKMDVAEGDKIANKTLKEIRGKLVPELLVGTILREGKFVVPTGDEKIQVGDQLEIIVPNSCMNDILVKLNFVKEKAKKVMLIGGGMIAEYLTAMLVEDKKQVTIIEEDAKRCAQLMSMFPSVNVVCGNGEDMEVLVEEGMKHTDVCISLTGKDESNLVVSLFAWSQNVKSVITKVNTSSYEQLLNKANIHITISPDIITVERLVRFIRNVTVYNEKGNDIKRCYQIADGQAEAIELISYDDCKGLNMPIKSEDFKLKKGVVIGAIIHDGKMIVPNGDSKIQSGDHVIAIAGIEQHINTFNEIFQ